jgi:hypothetical protein
VPPANGTVRLAPSPNTLDTVWSIRLPSRFRSETETELPPVLSLVSTSRWSV